MKKIKLFSAEKNIGIEGFDADLYVRFYIVLNKNYVFTFLIDAPNLSCSDRNPIKLWKHFWMLYQEECVKYMRRYERLYRSRTMPTKLKTNKDFTDGYEKGRADAFDECIAVLRQGMNELLKSPWANKSYMSNHDFEVREIFGIVDNLIIKKDLEQLKEHK